MAGDQQFCLRWNNHQSTLVSVFDSLLENSVLVDCTLAADGQQLKAHKVVLSACSPYLENLLSQHYDKHPIIILKDVKFAELKAMLDYMYRGEVNISQEQLGSFLKAAESLQIKGLTDSGGGINGGNDPSNKQQEPNRKHTTVHQLTTVAPVITNQPRLSSQVVSDERKPQNLSIPSHVLDSRSQSPMLQREGSVSPTLRKRKKLNQLNKTDNSKLVKSNDNTLNGSKINVTCPVDHQPPSHISSSNNLTPVSSPSANMVVVKSEPDVLPLSNKTEFKQNINDNISSVINDSELDNDENNENLYEEDTTNTTSPGPSHHFISQSYSEKSVIGDNSSEMLLQSDDMQNSNQDPLFRMNPYLQQMKLLPNFSVKADNQIQSFPCQRCGKVYNRKGNLGRHIRYECGKGPQFPCHLCEKKFFRREKLALHIKNHEILQHTVQLVRGQGRVSI